MSDTDIILTMDDRARLARLLHRMHATDRPLERELASAEALKILKDYGLSWGDAARVTASPPSPTSDEQSGKRRVGDSMKARSCG
jgi:hypothetical protein